MIKRFFILLLFTGVTSLMKAQDQLFKKDNSKLLVKITEITPDEIKYKLFSNLNGPTYVESKNMVSLIIFENGKHEVINTPAPVIETFPERDTRRTSAMNMSKADSLLYFKNNESVSLNFLSIINMELGLVYQRDFFKNNLSLVVPFGIGVDKPSLSQSVYNSYSGNLRSTIDRKLFEVGLGFNYYPSLRTPVNYYIGPVIRYMQYNVTQNYSYNNYSGPGSYYTYGTINKHMLLDRYCVSITNGFIIRTKSRLMVNIFASLGFKNDTYSSFIVDPNTNRTITPSSSSLNLYFWSGFNIGFTF